jgi:CubicO group peptidase (beta-lactamase class C family)
MFMSVSTSAFGLSNTVSMDKVIADYQAKHQLNAIIGIAKDGKLIFTRKIGYANIERKQEFSDHAQIPIASLTKQFTAVAILLLHDDKKIDLHKPIITYLAKDHPIWRGVVPDWASKITTHHLITHSSGLVNYTAMHLEELGEVEDSEMINEIITKIKDKPLEFEPGEKFVYNNTAYILLSSIIEELSPEKDMSKFLENRIFRKLHMANTYLPSIELERKYNANFKLLPELANRYIGNLDDKKGQLERLTHGDLKVPFYTAGGMISSAADLVKWNHGLYSGQILSEEALKLMTSPHISTEYSFIGKAHYGYGIIIDKIAGQTIYRHGGWIVGIRSELSYNPVTKTTVLILNNISPDEKQDEEAERKQAKALTDLATKLQKIADN